jgi:hypothetical protein
MKRGRFIIIIIIIIVLRWKNDQSFRESIQIVKNTAVEFLNLRFVKWLILQPTYYV